MEELSLQKTMQKIALNSLNMKIWEGNTGLERCEKLIESSLGSLTLAGTCVRTMKSVAVQESPTSAIPLHLRGVR